MDLRVRDKPCGAAHATEGSPPDTCCRTGGKSGSIPAGVLPTGFIYLLEKGAF
jgi:hypothetical protein